MKILINVFMILYFIFVLTYFSRKIEEAEKNEND